MASDSSDSPVLLTPESTGTSHSHGLTIDTSLPGSPTTSSSGAAKKSKRGTAFYPNVNSSNKPQKPFSRSAAKRESVMALGSIEHLQHYFTKTGLAAKKNPLDKPHAGLVRAIGGMGHVPTSPSLSDIQDFQMPPSPAVPSNPPNPIHAPHVKVAEVDPESLLPGVIDDVITAAQAWKLERPGSGKEGEGDGEGDGGEDLDVHFDVLDVLKTTTRAIRSTRNYLLSLPDEEAGTIRAQFRPALLGPGSRASSSTNLSASTSGSGASSSSSTPLHPHSQTQTQPQPQTRPDPLVLIRRSALEVLATLRQVEETCRLPLSDDAYDAQSDGGHSRGAGTASSPSNGYLELPPTQSQSQSQSHPHHHHAHEASNGSYADPDASITFSLVQVNGRYQNVPVWEDEEDVFAVDSEEEKERRERWDERLVLGSGWLYRQDVKLRDLRKERAVVGAYLDIVDEVLFDGRRGVGEERGWDRVRRKREGRAVSRAARSINRRVSAGEVLEGRSLSAVLEGAGVGGGGGMDAAGRRRVSTGMVGMMKSMVLSEEPEEMAGMDEIREEEDEESVEDDDLPEWAKRAAFVDDKLGRAHALIHAFLPLHLQPYLASPSTPQSRTDFLASLSSGQLLCVAYNACVRKSKKPWGFVSKDSIHDIIALERAAAESQSGGGEDGKEKEGGKRMWTFRRTDNLRLWAGALKLRYMLPIHLPTHVQAPPPLPTLPSLPASALSLAKKPSLSTLATSVSASGSGPASSTSSSSNSTSTPTSKTTPTPIPIAISVSSGTPVGTPLGSPSGAQTRFNLGAGGGATGTGRRGEREPVIVFDARVVAKREEGWEDMLERVLVRWVERAVEERRVAS